MAANINDKFNESTTNARPVAATTTAIKTIGATTLTVDSLADWPTDTAVHFTMFEIDANNKEVANTRTDWKAIKTSATTLGTLTLQAGTDREYPIGSKVICAPTAAWADDLVEGLLVSHDQDGTLKTDSVDVTAVIKDSIITPAKLDSTFKQGWFSGELPAVSSVTHNGNRSYDVVFASTVASTLSPGMRLKLERTVAAPTTAFSLDGSNDYYSKTSPAGLSFTTTFTCSAWVYATAYQAGYIMDRINGTTEGWGMYMSSDGRITIVGRRIAANSKDLTSYQSIPLNRWVHVAATIDMAAGDTSAQKIWIDGVEVPRLYTLTGTATALVQGTTALAVGARSDGSSPFAGYIDQAAVFSSQLSDATIKAMMHQGLTGSETSLISAYANGSTTDLNTTNANNLTAQNGATTVASAPWGNRGASTTLDYGLVMAVSTTNVTVQVPEGCTIPTTGGVTSVAYSTMANPFGWVADKDRWLLYVSSSRSSDYNITTSDTAYDTYKLPNYPAVYNIMSMVGITHAGGASARDYTSRIKIDGSTYASTAYSSPASTYIFHIGNNFVYRASGGEVVTFQVFRSVDNGGTLYKDYTKYTITQLTDFGL